MRFISWRDSGGTRVSRGLRSLVAKSVLIWLVSKEEVCEG